MIPRRRQALLAYREYIHSFDDVWAPESIYEAASEWSDSTCREALVRTLEQVLGTNSELSDKILSTFDRNLGI